MNYFNTLTELDIQTTHPSEKGTQQGNDFVDFARPLLPDIKKGEAAKAKLAEYYLEHKSSYTEGSINLLEPIVNQLGVSNGYVSQIKKAKEYKQNLHNKALEQWVDEHPMSIQYYISKSPHDKVMEKYRTGEHLSKREAEAFTRVKKEEELQPASEQTLSEYQQRCKQADEMVEDKTMPYLTKREAATTFMSGSTEACIAACMEKINRLSICDERRYK